MYWPDSRIGQTVYRSDAMPGPREAALRFLPALRAAGRPDPDFAPELRDPDFAPELRDPDFAPELRDLDFAPELR